MKNTILFLLLLNVCINSYSQTADSLIGYWRFADFSMDSTDYVMTKDSFQYDMNDFVEQMMRRQFEDVIYFFEKNKRYTLIGKKEKGNWKYNERTKNLTFTATEGTISDKHDAIKYDVLKLRNDTLVLWDGDSRIVLKRSKSGVIEDMPKVVLTCATKEEIAKKWYVIKRELPDATEEQIKSESDKARGSYIDIKANDVFEKEMLNIKEQGDWTFGLCNSSIILLVKESNKIWNITWYIKSISETELVLINSDSKEVMTLSTKK